MAGIHFLLSACRAGPQGKLPGLMVKSRLVSCCLTICFITLSYCSIYARLPGGTNDREET